MGAEVSEHSEDGDQVCLGRRAEAPGVRGVGVGREVAQGGRRIQGVRGVAGKTATACEECLCLEWR